MSEKLNALKEAILADGEIDENEVKEIEALLMDDGVIDRVEAEFLFALNDATSGKENHRSWDAFFVQAVSAYVLDDEESPGVIDAGEAAWLVEQIGADGNFDANEKALIINIKANAKEIHADLDVLTAQV